MKPGDRKGNRRFPGERPSCRGGCGPALQTHRSAAASRRCPGHGCRRAAPNDITATLKRAKENSLLRIYFIYPFKRSW